MSEENKEKLLPQITISLIMIVIVMVIGKWDDKSVDKSVIDGMKELVKTVNNIDKRISTTFVGYDIKLNNIETDIDRMQVYQKKNYGTILSNKDKISTNTLKISILGK